MNRSSRYLTIAAVFVVSAFATATAAAEFHSEGANTTWSGKQVEQHVFTFSTGSVKCTTASFSATSAATTFETLLVTPTYSGCTLAGAAATVSTNGCGLTFLAPTTTGIGFDGSVSIVCPVGKVIEFVAPTCKIFVGAQGPLSKFNYTNVGLGSTREIQAVAAITGLHYVQETTTCLGNGGVTNVTFTTGKITGTILFTGFHIAGLTVVHTGVSVT